VGCALSDERLSFDLICDGVHVDPRVVKLAFRAQRDRLVLITDRVEPPPGTPSYGSGALADDGAAIRLPGGRLAGSSLTLDRAVRNACRYAGVPLLEAVAACTLRPARLLGLEAERGTLRRGARADLVLLDAGGQVLETWIAGECMYAIA
jgi:N-acetylglucosamine-6-phosphate deacetylase